MLAEIRELGEKFKAADDVPEALGATFPFSARLRPFLTLDCTDRYGLCVSCNDLSAAYSWVQSHVRPVAEHSHYHFFHCEDIGRS